MTPYYSPESFDLELLDTLEEAGLDYSFHMLCAWREKATGDLVWAEDSGCSCPAPFEDYPTTRAFERSREDLRHAVDGFPADPVDKRDFLARCGL